MIVRRTFGRRSAPCGVLNLGQIFFVCLLVILPFTDAISADNDHDGVDDIHDQCPNTAQLKNVSSDFTYAIAVNPERLKPGPQSYPVKANGCEPDSDSDGVVDSKDYCPDNSMPEIAKGVASNGCPAHTDHDGTPDFRDHCPGTPLGVKTDRFGCPLAVTKEAIK